MKQKRSPKIDESKILESSGECCGELWSSLKTKGNQCSPHSAVKRRWVRHWRKVVIKGQQSIPRNANKHHFRILILPEDITKYSQAQSNQEEASDCCYESPVRPSLSDLGKRSYCTRHCSQMKISFQQFTPALFAFEMLHIEGPTALLTKVVLTIIISQKVSIHEPDALLW